MTSSLIKTLGASALVLAVAASGATAKPLSAQTKKNLETAMHGEAYANLKYQAYAASATDGGNTDLAKLFTDSANVEANEHFDREAHMLGLAGSNEANLTEAAAGEHYENTKMYVEFAASAEKDGDTAAAALFRQIAADEGDHYEAYKKALATVKAGPKS
ncbi:rubrerythrin family protein [Asticcacaulis benevestitus]|uniref:Ferritin-like diiron domain-containing protein n=1 Tax=Asticcacaulis benevestitus DSM 16100 = ATCC BAA-896 TaxID=1121022 RepID=V4P410_9CAUL|nr:rubrerythrin family protein [Asticcacaulis benevestitus]ESQ81894.1 hypothetical protein ABENE_21400 [Asticcacaulis benevestitus DSM 16100 = ATCC BAA-896]